MKCPHCKQLFNSDLAEHPYYFHKNGAIVSILGVTYCPGCQKPTILLRSLGPCKIDNYELIFPKIKNDRAEKVPPEVPSHIKQDYTEACEVLSISTKAAAALARRCLQTVLREHGYAQHDLVKQIDAVLAETDPKKYLPSHLHETIDCVRNFGNFSAHPITDKTTLQIIEVEAGEAEFCLDILDALFDHYYVKPEQVKLHKDNLNKKLAAAGKPPAK